MLRIFFHYFLRHFILFALLVSWVLFIAWALSLLVPWWVPSWSLVLASTVLGALLASAFRMLSFRLFRF